MNLRKNWGWFIVAIFSILASWHYFFGTPHVLGLDYFIHLTQADIVKQGIADGIPIPAYHYLHGAGTTFIRYQGMLIAQLMGWCCFVIQLFIDIPDTAVIILVGRLFGLLLNLGAGLSFYWAAKKIIDVYGQEKIRCTPSIAVVAACAYIFGWSRWGVLLHVGSLQRAGALILFPITFAVFLTLLHRPLKKNEQVIMAISTSLCIMCHPGSFIYLIILCIIYFIASLITQPSEVLQWQKLRTIILPAIISFCLAAWFIFPMVLEKEYYGMMRRQQQTQHQVSWGEVLPTKYALEFVNRENWFSNLSADPDNNGSFLGSFGGVNSAYFGIIAMCIALFGFFISKNNPLKHVALNVILMTLFVAIIIFWRGFRHNIFHFIGHHLTLPFYWLEPLYFCLCACVLMGAISISELLLKIKKEYTVNIAMIFLATILCLDFFSLVTFNKAAGMYFPQNGQTNSLGISGNDSVFDAYEILKDLPHGRVLDLPKLLFNCNRLYHGHHDALPEEPNTDWTEAKYYNEQVLQKEILEAIPFSLEYGNRGPLTIKYIHSDTKGLSDSNYIWESKKDWQGAAHLDIGVPLPPGKFKCWIVLPTMISPQTTIETFYQNASVGKLQASTKGYHYYIVVPIEKKDLNASTAQIKIKIEKDTKTSKVVIGVIKPFIAYAGNSLAHRLSILNVAYVVLNRKHFRAATGQLANSKAIRKIHQSRKSVLYKNTLSSPVIVPRKVMQIKSDKPWELFHKISHHPNFNPHQVSFLYGANGVEDVVTAKNWQEKLVPLFLSNALHPKVDCQITYDSLQSITYEIESKQNQFFFPSLRYHPNLVALVNDKPVKKYLAQAGMIAIKIPTGKCKITIHYQHPWYDTLGKWISLLTILLLFIYAIHKIRHK
ncbi:YfhO family protein [Candidatus Uabimicrobium amorphum]|uniref:Uncharacterized protein n=1 Tax=Uabimicrobium amorphum TaxID=2596890 RepID=A0A5S9F7T6_UABAM|nr:YfhO family protein [Candidatus Uabimicrobium amorphum]BBM87582.1 hypothetical protein UABAM_05994 [Candidatus Uabimicrobium amorphum]